MKTAQAIFTRLSADAAVTALVGSGTSAKIYPVTGPQELAAPYVIFQAISATPATTRAEPAGAVMRLVQFACFAESFEDAQALRAAVVAALDGVTLDNGENGTLEGEGEGYDDAAQLHRADADILF